MPSDTNALTPIEQAICEALKLGLEQTQLRGTHLDLTDSEAAVIDGQVNLRAVAQHLSASLGFSKGSKVCFNQS